ncbi:MAG: hypothetical protein DRJ15_11240 [Bacteroidetes bacterium]|nr:MAG: hypothetical protein DRJ15_11240 [Bacteroidota bacterium]
MILDTGYWIKVEGDILKAKAIDDRRRNLINPQQSPSPSSINFFILQSSMKKPPVISHRGPKPN